MKAMSTGRMVEAVLGSLFRLHMAGNGREKEVPKLFIVRNAMILHTQ